jgi:UDP-N-acetylmuramoylalanine--D-glutamate ligase
MNTSGLFQGKKVTVMGLGLLGRGVGDVKFLAEEGAQLIVTDLKTKEELKDSLAELSEEKMGKVAKNIKFVLGEHRLEDFRNRDFILKAAGVPIDSIYIEEARKNNIRIEMSAALFASLTEATVIGITGTRGKSTVTHLLYEVLKQANAIQDGEKQKVFLGGNIRGVSTLPFVKIAKKGDIAVLELDSWQLQGFNEKKMSPHISIFTTFYPDHLNYYKNNLAVYLDDKAAIFKYQNINDILIIGAQAEPFIAENYKKIGMGKGKKIIVDESYLPEDWQLSIPGDHNRYNAALVLAAARTLLIPDIITKDITEKFKGVPGRLEFIREYNNIKIYNDTTATTPDATLVALKALGSSKNIILIIGGNDKSLDISKLAETLPEYCKAVITLPGTGTDKLLSMNAEIKINNFQKANSLKESIQKALDKAEPGDIILFSPAFTSFGMFKNEFDRGEQFNKIIKDLP